MHYAVLDEAIDVEGFCETYTSELVVSLHELVVSLHYCETHACHVMVKTLVRELNSHKRVNKDAID